MMTDRISTLYVIVAIFTVYVNYNIIMCCFAKLHSFLLNEHLTPVNKCSCVSLVPLCVSYCMDYLYLLTQRDFKITTIINRTKCFLKRVNLSLQRQSKQTTTKEQIVI